MARLNKKRIGATGAAKKPRKAIQTFTADEIASLTSRFDAEKWDATADADRAAEAAARTGKKRMAHT